MKPKLSNENQQSKYPLIEAWGLMMGSYRYYREGEIAKAVAEKAPKDAIYRQQDGTWAVADERIKRELQPYLDGTKGGIGMM